jgi:hypothetical protein
MAALLVLLWCAAEPVKAGIVYGQVVGAGAPGDQLVILDTQGREMTRIMIQPNGDYQVFLPPGVYRMKLLKDNRDIGEIRSATEPRRQDVIGR